MFVNALQYCMMKFFMRRNDYHMLFCAVLASFVQVLVQGCQNRAAESSGRRAALRRAQTALGVLVWQSLNVVVAISYYRGGTFGVPFWYLECRSAS